MDLTAHVSALTLTRTGEATLDALGACGPSFTGGQAVDDYAGECWLSASGIEAENYPPPCTDAAFTGGCAHAPMSGGPSAVFGAIAVAWLRRALVLAVLVVAAPSATAADVLPPLAVEPGPFVYLTQPTAPVPWTVHARLGSAFREQPVGVILPSGERLPLLRWALTTQAAVGLDLHRIARLTVGMPLNVATTGDGGAWVPARDRVDGVYAGDVTLQLAGSPFVSRTARDRLSVATRVDIPTTPEVAWLSGLSFSVDAAWFHAFGPVELTGQLGVLAARGDAPTAVRLGVGAAASLGAARLALETSGAIAVENASARGAPSGPWNPWTLTLSAGGSPSRGVTVGAFGSAGLTSAIGAPRWEVGLVVSLSGTEPEDLDGDGLANLLDRCARTAEDADNFRDNDGCPDVDNDDDGLSDASDACPNDAEVVNGLRDSDGCPDRAAFVDLTVVSGAPLEGPIGVSLNGAAQSPLLDTWTTRLPLEDGESTLDVHADGHLEFHGTLFVPPGTTTHVQSYTVRLVAVSEVRLLVTLVTEDGTPIQGTVTIDDGPPRDIDAPSSTVDTTTGPHRIRAAAVDHATRAIELSVDSDEQPVRIMLAPSLIQREGRALVLRDEIFFPLDEAKPTAGAKALLDQLADWLREHPEIEVLRVEGHADEAGGSRHNLDLSRRRAEAVVDALVQRGVAEQRLEAIGSGETTRAPGAVATRSVSFTILAWRD